MGSTANFLLPGGQSGEMPRPRASSANTSQNSSACEKDADVIRNRLTSNAAGSSATSQKPLFTSSTKAIVWGMQTRAVQSMLDFDFVCSRKEPSVAAMVYPFTGDHKQKFYWGHGEVFISVYKNMDDAMKKHPTADVLVNFASLRSAYDSTLEAMNYSQIRTIAIIAEGIPENMTRELNNIIAHASNGVCEGVAIGGDRYPGTTFIDHLLRYQNDPQIKMLVLLGEVGGVEEYEVCRA